MHKLILLRHGESDWNRENRFTGWTDVAGVADVTVALPRLLGGQGVLETFPLPLNEEETNRLRVSAGVIRQALDELG